MSYNAEIRNLEMMENYKLYFRTRSRSSENYKAFVERTGREPNIIYPDGWYDGDIDRVIRAKYCVYFGIQELKHTDNLNRPFYWNSAEQREKVKQLLTNNHYNIEFDTLHYTIPYKKRSTAKWYASVDDNINYNKRLKTIKRLQLANDQMGKGVFLFVFYTDNLEYFAPINFTGSRYVFGDDNLGVSSSTLDVSLNKVGCILEPCFNEYLLFLTEAYIRQDFETLYDYLLGGENEDLIRYAEPREPKVSNTITNNIKRISKYDAVMHVMEWILKRIHVDEILEHPRRYSRFVNSVRTGRIADHIRDIIIDRVDIVRETYQPYQRDSQHRDIR